MIAWSGPAAADAPPAAPADGAERDHRRQPPTLSRYPPPPAIRRAPATTVATATSEPAAPPRALSARRDRPAADLPAGLGVLGADASANHDFSAMGGAPIVGYGFTDDLEIQVPYGFATKDFELKGSAQRRRRLQAAARRRRWQARGDRAVRGG